MSFLPIAILGYILNGGAVVIDKILLNTSLPKPAIYTFYISMLGLLAILLLPFGFEWQNSILLPAFLSGATATIALLTFFQSLKLGEASVAGPVIGALNPLFALILGITFFNQPVSGSQFTAILVLILGTSILTFNLWFSRMKSQKQLLTMILSGFFFALSYVFLKEVFLHSNFITGLVLTRFFGAVTALSFLLMPDFRKQIFAPNLKKHNFFNKTSLLLLTGQSMGAAQGFLLAFAVSLASPALVNSLFGVQYLVILGVSLALAKKAPKLLDENLSKKVLFQKILGAVILSLGVYLLSIGNQNLNKPVTFGVSFSPQYATELGLDPKLTYQSILSNLGTKSIRLSANWDEIEPFDSAQGKPFDFSDLDWYLNEAEKYQAKVILAIGYKLPRWPECRQPRWLEIRNLRDRQLVMLKKIIGYYEKNPTIWAWQLENEPLLNYGVCPPPDREFLQKEIEFVRTLTQKPIIISDSGELGLWITPAKLSDILGITLYRTVETPLFGSFQYPLPPWFYQLKANLVRKKTIVVELQSEPWATHSLTQTPLDKQIKRFSLEQFKKNVEFAQKTGFDTVYLWGVEWWYFMAANGHPEYLDYAKGLFKLTY